MKQLFLLVMLVGGVVMAPVVGYAEEEQQVPATQVETAVATNVNMGILPTSPWYFLKEWKRAIQQMVLTNPVARAEFEANVAEEKAAEAKKVEESSPQDARGIKRAMENYRRSQDRLRGRLEQLKETSNNPNIDKLLTKVSDRVVAHQRMFEEMRARMEEKKDAKTPQDTEGAQNALDAIREKAKEIMGNVAKKDAPEQFKKRLEQSLLKGQEGTTGALRALEFMNEMKGRVPEVMADHMEQLKAKIGERAQEDIVKTVREEGVERLKDKIKTMPGTAAQKLKMLDDLRAKAKAGVAPLIDTIRTPLEKQEQTGRETPVQ